MKVFAIASAVLSIFAAVASAQEGVTWTKPNTEPEKGNVITRPGLYEKVPVGKPYTITWIPSGTEGPIDIVLYKGPGSNIIPQYALASKIPNTGTFVWTPETTFPDTKEGYGIRIIVVKDGQHQWSTQFGFSNPGGANLINTPNPTTTDKTGLVAETTTSASVPTGNTTSTKSATASASTSHSVTVSSNRTTTTTSKASTMTTVTTSASTLILTASETEEATTTAEPTGNTTTTTIASGNAAVATAVSYGMGVIAFAAAGMALL